MLRRTQKPDPRYRLPPLVYPAGGVALLDRYTPLTPPPSDRSLLLLSDELLTPPTGEHHTGQG